MPQRERFDTHDLRRGLAELRTISHGATARALRHARSPRGLAKLKTSSHGATARALRHARSPQRVRRAQDKFARRHSESASTRTISADGSLSSRQVRTAPQRERFDTHNLRRWFAELKTSSHGATARALRHARSPQRVRRAQDTFARRHSERVSTRTISAEGSPSSRQVCTAPQRERLDTRRGFAELKTRRHSESASTRTISAEGSPSSRHIHSHGATARALRHAQSPQRVRQAQDKFARRHSESASTRTISAEGSPSSRQIRTAPQRERFDTHDLRRRFAELKTSSHGATARALRHAQSPQMVRRAQDKFARRHSESASTRTISAEGSPSSRHIRTAPQRESFDTHNLRRGFAELKTRRHSESASTRAEGSPSSRHGATARALRHAQSPQRARRAQDTFIRTAPQRERFDTHNLRRGFAKLKTSSHGATARALRHARSPQRVRRAQDKFARRHSESASTRTISADGSLSSRQVRTAPQRERFDTHNLRRWFAELKTSSHGATARALRHARSPQRVRRAQDTFARRHSERVSTRTISAEGSPSSRHGATARALRHAQSPQRARRAQDTFIRTAPQRERFDTHNLRRGFTISAKGSLSSCNACK